MESTDEREIHGLNRTRSQNSPSLVDSSSDHRSVPYPVASSSPSFHNVSINSSPTKKPHLRYESYQHNGKPIEKPSESHQNQKCSSLNDAKEPFTFGNSTTNSYSQDIHLKAPSSGKPSKPAPSRNESLPLTPRLAQGKKPVNSRSQAGKQETIRLYKRDASGDERPWLPAFFKYGIQFQPDPGEADIYRTILISNLPSDATMPQVLDRIRGGAVLDAKLLDTTSITGHKSAMITFVHEHAALAYQEYATKHAVVLHGLTFKVTVLTPTWPTSPRIRQAITDYQHTRCLEVHNFPRSVSWEKLQRDLQFRPDINTTTWIISMHLDIDDVLKLEFSSIALAGHTCWIFSKYEQYANCRPYFVPDPCAQALETLEEVPTTFAIPVENHGNENLKDIEPLPQSTIQASFAECPPASSANSTPSSEESVVDSALLNWFPLYKFCGDPLKSPQGLYSSPPQSDISFRGEDSAPKYPHKEATMKYISSEDEIFD